MSSADETPKTDSASIPASGPTPVPKPISERRGPDRRKRSTPMFSRYTFFGGRRESDRRLGPNAEGLFVDRYDSSFFLFLAGIALFNLFDCFFTLVQIERGAEELNPFARMLIDKGPTVFVLAKSLGVGLIICFLCLHKNFRLARWTLWFAFAMYLGIFIYHIALYLIAISAAH